MIPVKIFQVEIQSDRPIDFGDNPGSAIRGALYETLSTIYDDNSDTYSVDDTRNPVAWLFRLDPRVQGERTVPRPFGIRPPLENRQGQTSFSIALYGKGCGYTPLILSGLDSMQNIGIGRYRQKFNIRSINQIDPITQQSKVLIIDGKTVGRVNDAPSSAAYQNFAQLLNGKHLSVEFLTPTRIVHEKKLSGKPVFSHWVGRLLSRIRKLSQLYTQDPIHIPFAELNPKLQTIQLIEDRTKWHETVSKSKRDGLTRPTSGYIGEAVFNGDLEIFLPYLILGQSLQVGTNVVKGSGWYQLRYDWL